jgi:hypothetical protein
MRLPARPRKTNPAPGRRARRRLVRRIPPQAVVLIDLADRLGARECGSGQAAQAAAEARCRCSGWPHADWCPRSKSARRKADQN